MNYKLTTKNVEDLVMKLSDLQIQTDEWEKSILKTVFLPIPDRFVSELETFYKEMDAQNAPDNFQEFITDFITCCFLNGMTTFIVTKKLRENLQNFTESFNKSSEEDKNRIIH